MTRVLSVAVVGFLAVAVAGCQLITDPANGCMDVKGTFDPAAPGVLIEYQKGVDPVATTAELEAKYDFHASHVYTALAGFSAQLSASALAGVSCESSVALIEHDGVATLAAQ
jgi:hypothetical protein